MQNCSRAPPAECHRNDAINFRVDCGQQPLIYIYIYIYIYIWKLNIDQCQQPAELLIRLRTVRKTHAPHSGKFPNAAAPVSVIPAGIRSQTQWQSCQSISVLLTPVRRRNDGWTSFRCWPIFLSWPVELISTRLQGLLYELFPVPVSWSSSSIVAGSRCYYLAFHVSAVRQSTTG